MKQKEGKPQWVSYSSEKQEEERSTADISYADASEYQETEFGPLPVADSSSVRAYRLSRREGYSPTEADKPRVTGALASTLDLSKAHTEEVCSIMAELNLASFGSQRRLETVALGVIAVIVNYERFQRQQNPDAIRISETPKFQELMMEFEIDYSDLGTAKRVVKQELRKLDYFG